MQRVSAGLLMYRIYGGQLQVFLANYGGPFFANKNEGFWSIPKGELEPGEDVLEAAKREFIPFFRQLHESLSEIPYNRLPPRLPMQTW